MGDLETAEREFVEQIASNYESRGLSPTAGRIVGRLLVARPAAQSSKELAAYVQASKGAISTQTQVLIQAGFVEKIRKPGSRETWYQLKDAIWLHLLEREVEATKHARQLADTVMAAQKAAGAEPSPNLEDFRRVQRFFERRVPRLIEEWRELQDDD